MVHTIQLIRNRKCGTAFTTFCVAVMAMIGASQWSAPAHAFLATDCSESEVSGKLEEIRNLKASRDELYARASDIAWGGLYKFRLIESAYLADSIDILRDEVNTCVLDQILDEISTRR